MNWTEAETKTLFALSGVESDATIAHRVGRTEREVRTHRDKWGLTGLPPHRPAKVAE